VVREKGEAMMEVTDNGPGMSDDTLKGLFQPFFRAPEARAMPGHGLGMATTKRLVEAHGGTIVVKSEIGVGTQVMVRLPLADRTVEPPSRRPQFEVDRTSA
jgi:signal transduction histidine kinase